MEILILIATNISSFTMVTYAAHRDIQIAGVTNLYWNGSASLLLDCQLCRTCGDQFMKVGCKLSWKMWLLDVNDAMPLANIQTDQLST